MLPGEGQVRCGADPLRVPAPSLAAAQFSYHLFCPCAGFCGKTDGLAIGITPSVSCMVFAPVLGIASQAWFI